MVDHDVAQRANWVVEVAAVLDPEVLSHGDLDALEVVPVPDRLEHRVREPEVENLLEAHLPEEVVDPVDLGLVDVLVKLGGERAGGIPVVAKRLLDDDPPGFCQPGLGEPFDNGAEEEGGNLEVEDRRLSAVDCGRHLLIRRGVGEVPALIREPRREAVKNRLVDLFTRSLDRVTRPFLQVVVGPVVDRDSEDRAVEEPARLEPVERVERHHLRQIAGDPEDDEDVGDLRAPIPRCGRRCSRDAWCDSAGSACHSPPPSRCFDPIGVIWGWRHPSWMILRPDRLHPNGNIHPVRMMCRRRPSSAIQRDCGDLQCGDASSASVST